MELLKFICAFATGVAAFGFLVLKWRCALVGHIPSTGYSGLEGGGYLQLRRGPVDGINREHAALFAQCERCKTHFKVGNLHVHPSGHLFQQSRTGAAYDAHTTVSGRAQVAAHAEDWS
ncbi:hypothetical protein [Burkholderia ambifaria]|uniref:hypothetical protein n=1 Tax=Burkholderia ambifaria TaxID=152480 RepID=UPI000F811EE5|nr:hypothetical protein [Burkholderia ambifaria]